MKVFEDIIVELQEENLLEETVLVPPKTDSNGNGHVARPSSNGNGNGHKNGSSSANKKQPAIDRAAFLPKSERTNPADQMSALQFVEFVVSAAERLGGAGTLPYDDLQVQMAFHRYTQATSDSSSEEYVEAEAALVNSLRSWEEDLVKRDQAVPVVAIRRFAETANPPLSPQALFALIRFYRSVPVSENAYLKFDFVVTRLFSKFVDNERREIICSRHDVVKHLDQRYSEWGMNAFKSIPADDPDIALLCLSFDDFSAEAARAVRLSELVKSGIFERLCELKRSSGAMFFVPQVTSAVIECNLKISARLFDLLHEEAERGGLGHLTGIDNERISDAVARTFDLSIAGDVIPLSDRSPNDGQEASTQKISLRPSKQVKAKRQKRSGQTRSNIFGVNKWLLFITVFSVIVSAGLYIWSEYGSEEPVTPSTVQSIDLQSPEIAAYIKTAKVNNDMLHAVITPKYMEISADKRRDLLQQVRELGETKGYKRVTFYDQEGKTIAYASADRIDIR